MDKDNCVKHLFTFKHLSNGFNAFKVCIIQFVSGTKPMTLQMLPSYSTSGSTGTLTYTKRSYHIKILIQNIITPL